ncbi:MAG TPA: hypothetical protein VKG45_05720 [Actinomycetes bacterium]|nr:hypothetical protein [Actinomycetes bacterium]
MPATTTRLRWLIAALLLVGATLFAVGVGAERNRHTDVEAAATAENGESAEHRAEEATRGSTHDPGGEAAEPGEEWRIAGLNPEGPGFVVLGVLISAVLAATVVLRPLRAVLVVVAVVALAFAVLDTVEIIRQAQEANTGLSVLVALVALAHITAAGGAAFAARRPVPATTMPA